MRQEAVKSVSNKDESAMELAQRFENKHEPGTTVHQHGPEWQLEEY